MDPLTTQLIFPLIGMGALIVALILDLTSKAIDAEIDGYVVYRYDMEGWQGKRWCVGAYTSRKAARRIAKRCGKNATYQPFILYGEERRSV